MLMPVTEAVLSAGSKADIAASKELSYAALLEHTEALQLKLC